MKARNLSRSILFAFFLASSCPAAIAQPQSSTQAPAGRGVDSPEFLAARQAVERYFRAADSGDPQLVKDAFSPHGRVEGVLGGRMVSWTANEFADDNFRGKQPENAAAIKRTIEWLDVSGPGAVARVKIDIEPNRQYFDYFILFKTSGEWKIGLKAFANPPASES